MVIVPAVVDLVGDVPVVARAGSPTAAGWPPPCVGRPGRQSRHAFPCLDRDAHQRSVEAGDRRAGPLDTVKVDFADAVLPPLSPGGVPAVPRVLRTAFVDRWNADPAGAHAATDRLRTEVRTAAAEGRLHELLPFTGQSVALIHDIASAKVLIGRIMTQAETCCEAALAAGFAEPAAD